MGKAALELAVGTGQWNAGLKKAKSALDSFTEANGGLRQALDKESQKMQTFVRMMGGFESTAKTAKGQINDYKSAIEQLTMQYNRMTEAQRQAVGEDYLQTIEQLKQKYHAVNEEIQEMNRSLNNVKAPDLGDVAKGGSMSSQINGKLDGMVAVFGGNLMTKATGMVTGFAGELGNAVAQGIELARQGEGIRIAFERLGRGDILDGLREATHGTVTDLELMKAAVKFNDFNLPVEELGTMLAFAQQKAKDTGQSVDYMVDSIVTGLGRKSLMILDNLGLSAADIKEKMKETGDMTKAVGEIIREQMSNAGDYVETAADRATRAEVDLQNSMEELGRTLLPLQEQGVSMWGSMKLSILKLTNEAVGPAVPIIISLKEGISELLDTVIDNPVTSGVWDWITTGAGYASYALPVFKALSRAIDEAQAKAGVAGGANAGAAPFRNLPAGNNTTNTTEPAADSITAQQKEVQRLTDLWQNASSEMRDGYLKQLEKAQATLDKMMGKTSSSSAGHKKETEVFAPDSIVAQQKEVQRLTGLWQRAGGEMREGYLRQLEEAKFQLEQLNGKNVPRPWGGFAVGVGPAATSPGIADERIKIQAELDAENMKIDKETLRTVLTDAVQNGIDLMDLQFGEINAKIQNGVSIPDETWQRIIDQYNRLREQMGMDPITIDITTGKTGKQKESNNSGKNKKNSNPFLHTDDDGKQAAKVNELLGGMANGISQMTSGLETLGVEIPEGMKSILGGMQAVSTILSSILTIVSVIQAISAADAIIPFARGGTVGRAASGMLVGTHMSGDNLRMPVVGGGMVGVNDGELILNRAQQGNLASQFDGNGFGSLSLETVLRGEDIRIVLNNNGRRTGYGEFVQSRKRS